MRAELISGVSMAFLLASTFWPAKLLGQALPLELVKSVNLQRYQGLWYEIARLPNRFQDECASNVTAEYTLMDNGRIKVINRCTIPNGKIDEVEGVARRPDPAREAALKVRFAPRWLSWLPVVWGDYQIMALGEDYDSALVDAPSRDYLWILARQSSLPQERITELMAEAERQGFKVEDLIHTRQDRQDYDGDYEQSR